MPVIPDDLWFRAEATRAGTPVLIRARQSLGELATPGTHGKMLRITWKYSVDDESGLPSANLQEKMAFFENAVFDDLEKDNLCVLFLVYTHNGIKEWSAYTSNLEETYQRISMALEAHERYPIEMTAEDDSTWQEYTNVLKGTGML